jgi:toxin-antitoxin system PIN domain toxin
MSSLSFPDVNVWLALTLANHTHRGPAVDWWNGAAGTIAFLRITQVSVLRLLTTSAAMDGKPLTLRKAWAVYDRFFADDRVAFMAEPAQAEIEFRKRSSSGTPSPKVWADALLVASVIGHGGQLITFDKTLQSRGAECIVLQ